MSESLAQFIKRRRLELRLTQAQLAAASGVSRAAIGQWESGITAPSRTHAPAVARALQIHPGTLAPGLLLSMETVDSSANHETIPLMQWEEFGAGRTPDADAAQIYVGTETPEHSVALKIPDDAMAPDFARGEIVVVCRTSLPRDADIVVAQVDGSTILRRYVDRGVDSAGGKAFDLLSTTPDWPTITCNSRRDGKVLGVVIAHIRTVRR